MAGDEVNLLYMRDSCCSSCRLRRAVIISLPRVTPGFWHWHRLACHGQMVPTLTTSSMSLGCWTSRHWALVLVGRVLGILWDNQQPSVYSRVLLCPLHLSQLTFLCCSFPLLFFSLHFFPSPKYYKTLFPSYHSFFCCFCTSYSFLLLASISSH